ncbi:hypothetical protein Trco_006683 [Trichoderma cornu-damae]|uniref:Uncharacterized protein n=1 Tax=Trichoderma cornu-damae TaxID=654480 RepID=A0A9P8QFI8_9HYPO|nr:hypothetical protein Trco_006683 [Trichoderma cornu-damae]
MALESLGDQPRGSDRLEGRGARRGIELEAHHAPEALAHEVLSSRDPIATYLGDILHEGALGARESPARENRYERPRSPRRDWERDRPRDVDRERDRDWDRERNRTRDWDRDNDRRDDRFVL